MQTAIVKRTLPPLPALRKQAKDFADAALRKNTKRAYKAAWIDFKNYCIDRRIQPMPANAGDVADYITFCANGGLKVSTIGIRLAAISKAHKLSKLPDPTKDEAVESVMKGIRREIGVRPKQKLAITDDILNKIAETFKDDVSGIRNKAITLVGWAGAFRRSEVVSLNIEDLTFHPWGVMILLRESKTDQEKAGVNQPIPYLDNKKICPVLALKKWIEVSSIKSGPLFRRVDRWQKVGKNRLTDQVLATIIKNAVSAVGLDSDQFAFHSMRAGIITTLIRLGISIMKIQSVSRHKSMDSVIQYQRSAGLIAMQTVKEAFGAISGE